MATHADCRSAIDKLSDRIMKVDEGDRRAHISERTVSVRVTDLGTVFDMRLTPEGITGVSERSADTDAPRAQIRISVSGGDLVALSEDRLDIGRAVLSGRVRIGASFSDLRRIKKLL